VSFRANSPDLSTLTALPGAVAYRRDGERHVLQAADADQLVRQLVVSGIEFHDLEVRAASLEEAFLALTTTEKTGALR
jgi:ABC-2 type transport system ATP-binding protein